jgi:hypothetical protein
MNIDRYCSTIAAPLPDSSGFQQSPVSGDGEVAMFSTDLSKLVLRKGVILAACSLPF